MTMAEDGAATIPTRTERARRAAERARPSLPVADRFLHNMMKVIIMIFFAIIPARTC